MSITVVGLSHHSAPVALRECLAFPDTLLPEALYRLKQLFPEGGAVILNTCNRVEIYVRSDRPEDESFAQVRRFFSSQHGMPEAEFQPHLYELADREAVRHLFKVAASLDSMVVGE